MTATNSTKCFSLLSRALFEGDRESGLPSEAETSAAGHGPISSLGSKEFADFFGDLWSLANANHVIMRAFPALHRILAEESTESAEWIDRAVLREQERISHALSYLAPICQALEAAGDVIVIKSLDHWPDLGNDLDLYTNGSSDDVVAVMHKNFNAHPDERSWGDRLANKWNFIVPGLPELVEVHVARLGQTGEQINITHSLAANSSVQQFGGYALRVAAPEDRIIISTLQRMYRHFYIRLCDIADNARLVDSGVIDYVHLKSLAESAGLWNGLATYLAIVSDYVKLYSGEALPLPHLVKEAAKFGNELVRFKRSFLRIPIFPQAASLYAAEWKRLLLNGEVRNTFRLSLLPGLATAAALELKLTGSDKGIW
jgi:hypothetical protein